MSNKLRLFEPIQLGDIQLAHRIVFAPTTRYRADTNHVPLPHVAEYYEQRASSPGSLLITEANIIAPRAGGWSNAPGIWSSEQISAWKEVVDRVHAKGSLIFMELWAVGRVADTPVLTADGFPLVSASNVPITGQTEVPHTLTVQEIQEYVQLYATAASNAVHKAGFDGIDIGALNGSLLDQFLNDRSNIRTDEYGGSIPNRVRFPLQVADAIVRAIGQKKTAFRISPWGTFNDMSYADPAGPKPTFTHLVTELRTRYPDLAYLHIVEPRADGGETVDVPSGRSNDFIRGYARETAIAVAQDKGDLVAFSRPYVANPDLPYRLLHDIPLTVGDRALYYAPGSRDPRGYTDYPFADPVKQA
ncbi:hypothetical protein FB45DRAFT_1010742 [Roridomyces roridus]|uniref:NADH:flavin oxidoreductase/NADH oxidase N-terminal domain-containing protein n=1 Tax=Roridomyces roridus TaxID=1738132 RepID=A0AAD7FAN6_9AGAR|nr:hypothetical protein FB45DRAFT_1010742 [Roridomyces roridus]